MIKELSIIGCDHCKNYFFIWEMPDGLNDPSYCPYCGIEFGEIEDDREIM